MNFKTTIFKSLIIFLIIISQTNCESYTIPNQGEIKNTSSLDSLSTSQYLKGMFIRYYCKGSLLIKILDNSNIGKTWTSKYSGLSYENSIIAVLDTGCWKSHVEIENKYLIPGSIFYFKYINGLHPAIYDYTYGICEREPFVTITRISENQD